MAHAPATLIASRVVFLTTVPVVLTIYLPRLALPLTNPENNRQTELHTTAWHSNNGAVNDVTFSHNGAHGAESTDDVLFDRVRQVAAPVGGRAV